MSVYVWFSTVYVSFGDVCMYWSNYQTNYYDFFNKLLSNYPTAGWILLYNGLRDNNSQPSLPSPSPGSFPSNFTNYQMLTLQDFLNAYFLFENKFKSFIFTSGHLYDGKEIAILLQPDISPGGMCNFVTPLYPSDNNYYFFLGEEENSSSNSRFLMVNYNMN